MTTIANKVYTDKLIAKTEHYDKYINNACQKIMVAHYLGETDKEAHEIKLLESYNRRMMKWFMKDTDNFCRFATEEAYDDFIASVEFGMNKVKEYRKGLYMAY